jgi:hypothetical protein
MDINKESMHALEGVDPIIHARDIGNHERSSLLTVGCFCFGYKIHNDTVS